MSIDRTAVGLSLDQLFSVRIERKQGFVINLLYLILTERRDQIAIDDLLVVTIDDLANACFHFSIKMADREFGDINEAPTDIHQST